MLISSRDFILTSKIGHLKWEGLCSSSRRTRFGEKRAFSTLSRLLPAEMRLSLAQSLSSGTWHESGGGGAQEATR